MSLLKAVGVQMRQSTSCINPEFIIENLRMNAKGDATFSLLYP